MRLKIPSLRRLGLLLALVVPVAAWLLVKPVRVIAPSWVGVSCLSVSVCVDDASQYQAAAALRAVPFEYYRQQFLARNARHDKSQIWREAEKL